MSKTIIPQGYESALTLYETQNAIGVIHHTFEENLSQTLNLKRSPRLTFGWNQGSP